MVNKNTDYIITTQIFMNPTTNKPKRHDNDKHAKYLSYLYVSYSIHSANTYLQS